MKLKDRKGVRHLIQAFGLELLSGLLPSNSFDGIKHEFSKDG